MFNRLPDVNPVPVDVTLTAFSVVNELATTKAPVDVIPATGADMVTLKPFQLQALLPPEQAVNVGVATLIALIVFVPLELTPPTTLTVEAMFRPVVVVVAAASNTVASVTANATRLPVCVAPCA